MSQFDQYASKYEDIHNKNLKLTGESSDFFVEHKMNWLAQFRTRRGLSSEFSFLDLGCGIGRTYRPFVEKFPKARYVGVDPSDESLGVARKQEGAPEFTKFDGKTLPFAEASFDVVFAACVLHHVPPTERPALSREILRVLRPGGHFVVFEHNPWNPATQYIVRTCEFDDDAILMTARALRKQLKAAGFTAAESHYVLFVPGSIRKRFPTLEDKLAWCPAGAQYCTVAQK